MADRAYWQGRALLVTAMVPVGFGKYNELYLQRNGGSCPVACVHSLLAFVGLGGRMHLLVKASEQVHVLLGAMCWGCTLSINVL